MFIQYEFPIYGVDDKAGVKKYRYRITGTIENQNEKSRLSKSSSKTLFNQLKCNLTNSKIVRLFVTFTFVPRNEQESSKDGYMQTS